MNLGQILETHLGLAGYFLGQRYISPVFDGATEPEIKALLAEPLTSTSVSGRKRASAWTSGRRRSWPGRRSSAW